MLNEQVTNFHIFKDPSSFESLTEKGQGMKNLFSRLCVCRTTVNAYLFDATYTDQSPVEIQVDPAIDQETAKKAAERYAKILGRVPALWRKRIAIFTISPGIIFIYTYIRDLFLF